MEPRQLIRSGITASAIVHLSFLGLVVFFTEVHPFASVTGEPIAVDLVTPNEVPEKKPEPPPEAKPSDSFDLNTKAEAPVTPPSSSPPPAAPLATKPPPQQAERAPPPAASGLQPQPQAAPAQTQSRLPSAAYAPPQPDLSIKYHVLLGLPLDRPGDGFDAPATQKAAISSDMITKFRQHLRTCSTLPKSIVASDRIEIKLRVLMTPDGRLAAEPALIEASASEKGPALMHSAIDALQACQPYGMLPADRYREWKILDLKFTPLDFASAS